jgi:hypothetical protein
MSANYEKIKEMINCPLSECDVVDEFNLRSAHRDLEAACKVTQYK